MGGTSFVLGTAIGMNGLAVNLRTLIDMGANAFLVLNEHIAPSITHFLQYDVKTLLLTFHLRGFNVVVRMQAGCYFRAHLTIDGYQFYHAPFILADISQHDLILGKLFLE